MIILNLGSGVKTSAHPHVTNVDWSIYLRLKRTPFVRRLAPTLLSRERRERFERLPSNIVVYNLADGIPFADDTADVIYHSHLLEHLDRSVAPEFMHEVHRVLKPRGVQRIVVPDLEGLCRAYLEHLEACESDRSEIRRHVQYVVEILEQSVRREAFGMRAQQGLLRGLERLLVGDARRRGETHQWMYDWANLTDLLEQTGFTSIARCDYRTSGVPNWHVYGLDRDHHDDEYKPGSLYIEASKG